MLSISVFLLMIPTLLGVAVLVFLLMRVVPGDIVEMRYAGSQNFVERAPSHPRERRIEDAVDLRQQRARAEVHRRHDGQLRLGEIREEVAASARRQSSESTPFGSTITRSGATSTP